MGFGEMGVLLISETIISTQTAVAAPPDPISEWNNTGHMLCLSLDCLDCILTSYDYSPDCILVMDLLSGGVTSHVQY